MTSQAQFVRSFNASLLKTSLLVGGCLFSGYALAMTSVTGFPYAPGISVSGLTGDLTTGYADAMVPVAGQPTQFFYLDPQALFHNNNDYSAALGLGARTLTEKAGILGAYVFGDYNHAPDGHGFWFVSPGIERLGDRVDFSANVYIPVGSETVGSGTEFGDQIGIYDGVSFAGHSEYDQLYNTYESVGLGGDVEVGYRLPVKNNTKIYLGGYHFEPKNADNITGGTVRLEVPFSDHLNATLSDGYDNVAHNTFKVGLTYNFVGRHTALNFKGNLLDRMVDPIHRNLIAVAGSAHTAQPIVNTAAGTGQSGAVMNNISFFLPSGPTQGGTGTPDGSYENPYIGLNQGNVDSANLAGNTNLFFNGGLGTYTSSSQINLIGADSVYGRQSYQGRLFIQPAEGDNRPVLDFPNSAGLYWAINSGDANIVVDSITVTNQNGTNGAGISFNNTSAGTVNAEIDNVNISNTGFYYGLFATNQDGVLNLAVNNSSINNNNGAAGAQIEQVGSGALFFTVDHSTFNGNSGSGIAAVSIGGAFNMMVTDSTFNETGGLGTGLGILTSAGGALNLTVTNSTFNGNTDGIYATNLSGTIKMITNNSTFNGNSDGILSLNYSGTSTLTANNSTFNNNTAWGIQTSGTSVTYPGSTFSGNGGNTNITL